MAIDPNLLIAAPVLQDYLVDKTTGLPLAAGVVTFYKDDSRTTLKNWYFQSCTSAPYNASCYIAGPNPMTLTAVGTFSDAMGNDIIPMFYPFNENNKNDREPYFITVQDSNGNLQFTRANFPFLPVQAQPGVTVPSLENYIINGEFWRNFGSANLPLTTTPPLPLNTYQPRINGSDYIATTLAPSAHDGFSMPDMIVLKDQVGATETISFQAFLAGSSPVLVNDITPEYYLDWNCSAFQPTQTTKCLQFPLQLHIETLENTPNVTVVFHANNVGTGPLNQIVVRIFQFTGSSVSSTNSVVSVKQPFDIVNGWNKYVTAPFTLPNADNLVLSGTGDDALYVQFAFPPDQAFHIQFAKPQLYLSSSIPTNDWSTYDQIDPIINGARTGDIRTSLNNFTPFGWVPLNDGVISNSGSITPPVGINTSRQNIDTWPLFNLLWNNVSNTFAPIYTSAGVVSTRGATAYDDWNANKQLQLTLTLGRSLLGLPPAQSVTYDRATTPTWGTVAGVFTASVNTNLLYAGAPVYLTGTMPSGGNFTANVVYYAIPAIDGSSTTQFQLASTYANALAGTAIAAGAASNNGSNIVVNWSLGGAFGEARHVQLTNEVGSHQHGPPVGSGGQFIATGTDGVNTRGAAAATIFATGTLTAANTPAGYPFNIVQPSVYYNIFMKL